VEEKLGTKYVESRSIDFSVSFEESGQETAIFFILSPGVDPLKDVEKLGHKLGFSVEQENFHNVSLGQGQESVAETALEIASRNGHWIVLQVESYMFYNGRLAVAWTFTQKFKYHLSPNCLVVFVGMQNS